MPRRTCSPTWRSPRALAADLVEQPLERVNKEVKRWTTWSAYSRTEGGDKACRLGTLSEQHDEWQVSNATSAPGPSRS